jgi:hypothetical protein
MKNILIITGSLRFVPKILFLSSVIYARKNKVFRSNSFFFIRDDLFSLSDDRGCDNKASCAESSLLQSIVNRKKTFFYENGVGKTTKIFFSGSKLLKKRKLCSTLLNIRYKIY